MDMARKFLQMGYTRSRRYANHKSGRKYARDKKILPAEKDKVKAISADFFYKKWQKARTDKTYLQLKQRHRASYENSRSRQGGRRSPHRTAMLGR